MTDPTPTPAPMDSSTVEERILQLTEETKRLAEEIENNLPAYPKNGETE